MLQTQQCVDALTASSNYEIASQVFENPTRHRLGDILDGRVSALSQDGLWVDIGQDKCALLSRTEIEMFQLSDLSVGDDLEGLCVVDIAADGEVVRVSLQAGPSESAASAQAPSSAYMNSRPPQAPETSSYTRDMLLRLRSLTANIAKKRPTELPFMALDPHADLDKMLVQIAAAGQLPPRWWSSRCQDVKRKALLAALANDHMHVVFAMQPQSAQFREQVQCVDLDCQFLREAMKIISAQHVLPVASIAWLLEQGASAKPLLKRETTLGRVSSLNALKEAGGPAAHALSDVLKCAEDSDKRVRCAVFDVLAACGHFAGDNTPQAASLCNAAVLNSDELPNVRAAAAQALGSCGRIGFELAAKGLAHESMEVQCYAASALGRGGSDAAPYAAVALTGWLSVDAKDQKMKAQSACLRIAAAQSLGMIGNATGADAAGAIARALQRDPDNNVREACAVALGQLTETALTHMETLACALDDSDEYVQQAAAASLEKLT